MRDQDRAAQFRQLLVRSFIRQPGAEPLTIDYDMNYRETFAAAVREGGIEGLLQSLSDRNLQNDAGAKLAPVLMLRAIGAPR